MKSLGLVALAVLGVAGLQSKQGRQGGPPAVYRTDVPHAALNVIAGAPTDHSIILSVFSATTATAHLSLKGTDGEDIRLDAGKPKEVELGDLKPGNDYEYTLSKGDATVEGHFRTAPPAEKSFTFDIQADSHLDGNTDTAVYERTLNNIVADHPDFLVDLGDTFMVDKYPTYTDSLKQYQAQRYWFSRVGSQMPVFLCLGNHDGETGWRARGGISTTEWAQQQRETYFPVIRPNAFYSGAPRRGLYYSWTWGNSLLVVLDPFVATTRKARADEDGWNWTLGAEQFGWLEKTLRSSKAAHKFVFIHHLVGGFGKDARGGVEAADKWEWGDTKEFPNQREGWAEPIHALMKRYRVTAMFHGHDHLYVRQEKDGILYLEVPQPSHARGDQTNSADEYGYKTGTLLGSSGHIRVTVGKDVKVEYVKSLAGDENRKVVDSTTLK